MWKVAPTATWMLPSLQNATLPEASSDVIETDVPAPMGISSGVLKNLFNTLVVSLESAVANPLTPVSSLPSPTN